jgi:hypothetical protein
MLARGCYGAAGSRENSSPGTARFRIEKSCRQQQLDAVKKMLGLFPQASMPNTVACTSIHTVLLRMFGDLKFGDALFWSSQNHT